MNRAPKYSKVELLLTYGTASVEKKEFEDCGLMITGDYIVVILDEADELNTTLTSTGHIFNLASVKSYKTHAK